MSRKHTVLIILIAAIGIFTTLFGLEKYHTAEAVLTEYPALQDLTPEEARTQQFLFHGDRLVHIRLHDNTQTYAVVPAAIEAPKVGSTITVCDFLNSFYVVEK
jgi:hypothetical protein